MDGTSFLVYARGYKYKRIYKVKWQRTVNYLKMDSNFPFSFCQTVLSITIRAPPCALLFHQSITISFPGQETKPKKKDYCMSVLDGMEYELYKGHNCVYIVWYWYHTFDTIVQLIETN